MAAVQTLDLMPVGDPVEEQDVEQQHNQGKAGVGPWSRHEYFLLGRY